MEKGMMKRPGVFRVLPTSLQKSISQGCGVVCARPSGWDNCFLSSLVRKARTPYEKSKMTYLIIMQLWKWQIAGCQKVIKNVESDRFLYFYCFFHAEIGQFGHFCFPQINQNSFCPLNSSQLLLKEASWLS